jgi:hypothetical protein
MAINPLFTVGNILTAAQMNNLPLGVAARVSTSPNQVATTLTDMTGVTVTWTPPSTSRIYLIVAQLEIYNSQANTLATIQLTDGSNNVLQDQQFYIVPSNNQSCTTITWVQTGLSGSTTRKIRFGRGFGNTGNVVTFGDQQLTVIDIGAT